MILPPVGRLKSLVPLLPALLTIKGRPLDLKNHFVFEPIFNLRLAPMTVLRAGRQLGKTRSITARLILQSALVPGTESLVITPLQEQSDRLSSVIFRPMIEDSPIKVLLRPDGGVGNVRRREFINNSIIHFLYAFLDAERVRGLSAGFIYIDEIQDVELAHLPVVYACMDAAAEPVVYISGTSKTKDTALETHWLESSQGIWHIPCSPCGFDNVCSLDNGHLWSIIGPARDDVSERAPGIVCHRCLKPIHPRHGRWVHRRPELERERPGFHVPQVLMPGHVCNPVKYANLLDKMNGGKGFSTAQFVNEVLGEAYDTAVKLISIDDLRKAAQGVGPNTEANAVVRSRRYAKVVAGVDWTGSGASGLSLTKIAVLGLNGDGVVDCFYGKSFPPGTDATTEAKEILRICRDMRVELISHDYNGGGVKVESIINSLGWDAHRLVPMVYRANMSGDMCQPHPASGHQVRTYWVLDKSRILPFVCEAIKLGWVRFFDFDRIDASRPGLLSDWLALVEEKNDTATGETYRVRRHPSYSDDFAHACAYGLAALWKLTRSWPRLGVAGRV